MALSFEMDPDKHVIQREIVTILDVLSDIGGFAEVIAFTGGIFLSVLNYKDFNNYLASKLFKMEGPDKTEPIKFKRTRVGNSFLFCRDNAPLFCTSCCKLSRERKAMKRAREALAKEIDVVEMLRMNRYIRELLDKFFTES